MPPKKAPGVENNPALETGPGRAESRPRATAAVSEFWPRPTRALTKCTHTQLTAQMGAQTVQSYLGYQQPKWVGVEEPRRILEQEHHGGQYGQDHHAVYVYR